VCAEASCSGVLLLQLLVFGDPFGEPYSARTPGAPTIMRKAFDWKRSRFPMLEVEAVPQTCFPYVQIRLSIVLCMRSSTWSLKVEVVRQSSECCMCDPFVTR
jgi:hypothetical protein